MKIKDLTPIPTMRRKVFYVISEDLQTVWKTQFKPALKVLTKGGILKPRQMQYFPDVGYIRMK